MRSVIRAFALFVIAGWASISYGGESVCPLLDFFAIGREPGTADICPIVSSLTVRLHRLRELRSEERSSLLDDAITATEAERQDSRAPDSPFETRRKEIRSIAEYLSGATRLLERGTSESFMRAEAAAMETAAPYVANESRSVFDARGLVKAARAMRDAYVEALAQVRAYQEVISFRQELTRELGEESKDLAGRLIKDALDSSVQGRIEKTYDRVQTELTAIISKLERIRDNFRRQTQELEYKIANETGPDGYRRELERVQKDLAEVRGYIPPRMDRNRPLLDQAVEATSSWSIIPTPR